MLEHSIRTRLENVLLDGNSPRRIIARAEDLRSLQQLVAGWDRTITPTRFWGVPVLGLEVKEAVEVWGLVIMRSEDAQDFARAAIARGVRPMIEPIAPGECFVLAEKGQARAA